MMATPMNCRWCDGFLPYGGRCCQRCSDIVRDAVVEEVKGGRWDGAWRATHGSVSAYGDCREDALRNLVSGTTLIVTDWNKKGASDGLDG